MKPEQCFDRIDAFLRSSHDQPRFVNTRSGSSLNALLARYTVGDNKFLTPSDFSAPDGDIRLDELYNDLPRRTGNVFLRGFTTQLRLQGTDEVIRFLKRISTFTSGARHLIVLCDRCESELAELDRRYVNHVYYIDSTTWRYPEITLCDPNYPLPEETEVTLGIDRLWEALEEDGVSPIIRTQKTIDMYPRSYFVLHGAKDREPAVRLFQRQALAVQAGRAPYRLCRPEAEGRQA